MELENKYPERDKVEISELEDCFVISITPAKDKSTTRNLHVTKASVLEAVLKPTRIENNYMFENTEVEKCQN